MKKSDFNFKFDFKKVNPAKVKQVALVGMACLLFVVGFINYKPGSNEEGSKFAVVENENADMIGDVELVSSGSVVDNEETIGAIVENSEVQEGTNTNIITNETTIQDSNYFETIRIERDAMYSRMLETYNRMLDNEKIVETQKAIAINEIEKITNNQNAIMISENLIKNKGFEDAVVLANEDVINVVVKSAALSNEDIGKIQNIIERQFGVSLENVNISNKN